MGGPKGAARRPIGGSINGAERRSAVRITQRSGGRRSGYKPKAAAGVVRLMRVGLRWGRRLAQRPLKGW